MDRRETIYIAGVAPDCRAQALRWGLGVESDLFCTAANLEDPESIRLEAALVQGIPRRIVHGPFNELCPAAIDPMVRQVTRLRYEQALAMARRMGTGRLVLHSGYIPLTSGRSFCRTSRQIRSCCWKMSWRTTPA